MNIDDSLHSLAITMESWYHQQDSMRSTTRQTDSKKSGERRKAAQHSHQSRPRVCVVYFVPYLPALITPLERRRIQIDGFAQVYVRPISRDMVPISFSDKQGYCLGWTFLPMHVHAQHDILRPLLSLVVCAFRVDGGGEGRIAVGVR